MRGVRWGGMQRQMEQLAYGREGLCLDTSGLEATVIRPRYVEGLADEGQSFREAFRNPMGCRSLAEVVKPGEKVAIVIPDITRALPNERLLRWVFAELPQVGPEDVVILSGTGSHRRNTEAEWMQMVGEEIYRCYRCLDHLGSEPSTWKQAGVSRFGYEVFCNREYVEADRRILLGFIEPHFMAGFSGGYKAAFPGLAAVPTIMHYHSAENIGHPRSAWGVLEGNPTQAHVRAGGSLLPVDLLINVTLNNRHEITRFFIGDPVKAHEAGCAFCKETAMVPCEAKFPIVITTNSGYPLDQNLYQTVKGLSAAAQITSPGGLILCASRCNDGFPDHGHFKSFLFQHASPEAMLETIFQPGFSQMDQWQVQILASVLKEYRVGLFSELPDEDVRRTHIEPVPDLRQWVDAERRRLGGEARVAILPEGPMTIPYVVG